ncbi:unnamed protein product [Wuchereria bancrofti]|uniref:Uncharacterized protein n=1 Tax=Wuchereria bancrofti TaxID=6293 RepID=A0A3P7E9X9_WUCBA|nr:unnamed protein product [Wuchereria bancrofti]
MSKNIFKEAIAEAKTVRDAAIATAKIALEETLTPKLQSMLSAKLQEIENEEELDEAKKDEEKDEKKVKEGFYPDETGDKIQDKNRAAKAALQEDDDLDLDEILKELDDELDEAKDEEKLDETKEDEEEDGEASEESDEDESSEEESEEDKDDETSEESEGDTKLKDLTLDDFKSIIKDIISQEMGNSSEEAPIDDLGDNNGGENNDLSIDDSSKNNDELDEINLDELLDELNALDESKEDEIEEGKKKDKEKKKDMDEVKKIKKELDEAIKTITVLRKELTERFASKATGNAPKSLIVETDGTISPKWDKSGLLAEIKDPNDRNTMAMLLENQAKQLVTEANVTGGTTSMNGGGYNSENWAGVALPLVRRVFGEIAAKEFVSVQPMNLPSGLVFYLDFKYGTGVNPFRTGDSLYSANPSNNTTDFANTSSLYGAGRFGYSINPFTSSVANSTVTTPTWLTFNFDGNYSASFSSYKLLMFYKLSQA